MSNCLDTRTLFMSASEMYRTLLALFVYLLFIATVCECHAGFSSPEPRGGACRDTDSCGRTYGPCGGNFTVDQVHTLTYHDIMYSSPRYQVHQLISHQNKTSVNKYIVSTIRRDTGSLVQSLTVFQNSLPFGFGLQEDIVWDLQVSPLFTAGGAIDSGEYTIQLAFDATDGGGEIYYSCLDVDFSSSSRLMIRFATLISALIVALL